MRNNIKLSFFTESNLNAETIDCELMKTGLGKGIVGKRGDLSSSIDSYAWYKTC